MAGAALSLLAVAFVFGYHATTDAMEESPSLAVTVSERSPASPGPRSRVPSDLFVSAARPSASKPARSRLKRSADLHALRAAAGGSRIPISPPVRPGVTDIGPIVAPAPAIGAEPTPTTGDGVREVGNALSATVQGTAGATDAVSAPLGPPVTAAVQKVLDLVTALLQGTTAAIGSTADAAPPRRAS
jgi:hypothetical protein